MHDFMNDGALFETLPAQADIIDAGKKAHTTGAIALVHEQYVVFFVISFDKFNAHFAIYTQASLNFLQHGLDKLSIGHIEFDYVRECVGYFFQRPNRTHRRPFRSSYQRRTFTRTHHNYKHQHTGNKMFSIFQFPHHFTLYAH